MKRDRHVHRIALVRDCLLVLPAAYDRRVRRSARHKGGEKPNCGIQRLTTIFHPNSSRTRGGPSRYFALQHSRVLSRFIGIICLCIQRPLREAHPRRLWRGEKHRRSTTPGKARGRLVRARPRAPHGDVDRVPLPDRDRRAKGPGLSHGSADCASDRNLHGRDRAPLGGARVWAHCRRKTSHGEGLSAYRKGARNIGQECWDAGVCDRRVTYSDQDRARTKEEIARRDLRC